MKHLLTSRYLLTYTLVLLVFISNTHSIFCQCATPSIYINENGHTQTDRYTKSFSTGTSAYTNINYVCNSTLEFVNTLNFGYADFTSTHIVSKHVGSSFSFVHHFKDNSSSLKIWVDWNKDGMFAPTEAVFSGFQPFSNQPVPPITGTISIPADQATGDYVMRIRSAQDQTTWNGYPAPCGNMFENGTSYLWDGSTLDFTLRVVSLPACFPITNLTETSHTSNSVSLSWTAVSGASSYNIKWGTPGFDPENEAGIGNSTSTSNIFTVNGLTPNTHYDIYVQANCGGTTSLYVELVNIFTGYCVPQHDPLGNSLATRLYSFKTQNAITNINYVKNSDSIYVNRKSNVLTSYAGNIVNCTFVNGHVSIGSQYFAWIDWNNDLDFDDLGEQVISTPQIFPMPVTHNASFTVPANVTPGFYNMRVSSAMQINGFGSPCGDGVYTGNWVDFTIEIINPPSCKPIQNLSATLNNISSTTLNWTATNAETQWNIQYGVKGFSLSSGTNASASGSPTHTINGLSPYTHYDFYVQANCGGTTSGWAGPVSIYTGHCIPTNMEQSTSLYFLQKFQTYNAISNINYETTYNVGWADNPTTILTTYEGNVVNYTLTSNNNQATYAIWVDWNNDLDFDDPGEDVLINTTVIPAPGIYNGQFTVPMSTSPGTYKMRIARGLAPNSISDPCSVLTNGNGNYTDFLINVQSATPPSCLPISSVVAQTTSYTSANMSWSANNGETTWNIEYGNKGFALGSGTNITVNSNNEDFNNLTTNQHYDFYIQAECGSGNTSTWEGPFSVYIGPCLPIGHENSPTNVNGFITKFITTGASQNINYTQSASVHPGNYVDNTNTILLTNANTQIDVFFEAPLDLRFFGIWVDWDKNLLFDNPSELMYLDSSSFYWFSTSGNFIVPNGTPTGDYRMRIQTNNYNMNFNTIEPCGLLSNGNTIDFTIRIVSTSACQPVISLTATPSSTTSIDVSWMGSGSEIGYTIEWGASSFIPGTNTYIGTSTISTNSYTINGLSYGNTYDIYVKADCGSGNISTWTSKTGITIQPCIPSSLSINTDFTSSFSTSGGLLNASYGPVTQNAYLGYSDLTSTQIIAQDAGMSFNFTHTFHSSSSDGNNPNIVRIWIDWNQDLIFSDGEEVYNYFTSWPENSSPWDHNGIITIPANIPASNYVMRVRSRLALANQTLDPCGVESFSTTLDFTLQVTGITTCPPIFPLSLTANTTSFTSANISWTSQGSESSWNIKYGTSGFDPNVSSGLGNGTSSTNSYTANNLSPNTTYDIYVQANCGSEQSIWMGPVTITTGYCVPTSNSSISYYVSGFETGNALSNINYNATSGVNYANETATSIQSYAGNNINYTIHTSNYIGYYSIWIDWNQDLDFDDAGELMYSLTTLDNINNLHSNTLAIPNGIPNGTYRMRIAHSVSNNNITSCGSVALGNIVDFTIVINDPPTCLPITSLQLVSRNYTSATLSWNPQGSETLWNIEYGISGFTQGTGTIVSSSTNLTTISGLLPNTAYQFYVRANCGNGDQSIWIGPINVLTGQCVPQGLQSSSTYFVGSFVTTDALENINYTANTALGYVDQTSTQITVDQNATFAYTITQNTGSGRYFIWIDWNNDLDFDDFGETILSTTDYLTSASGTITVPSNVGVGTYKMRIANSYLNNVSACGPSANGNYVDFTINIISCASTDVNAGTITGDSKVCLGNSTELTPSVSGGTWASSSTSIATINDGTINGNSVGTTTITYTIIASNGCLAIATHTIEVVAPQILTITGADTIVVNETAVFTVNFNDGNWTSNGLSISSSDVSTATIFGETIGTGQIIYNSNSVCHESTSKNVVVIEKENATPVGINDIDSFLDVKVFPNPSNSLLKIQYNLSHSSEIALQLVDVNGKVVLTTYANGSSGTNIYTLDISVIASGVYSLFLITENSIYTNKIVKNK